MDQLNESTDISPLDDLSALDTEIYHLEDESALRSCTDSGIPFDLNDIAFDTGAEFNLEETPVTRCIDIELPIPSLNQGIQTLDPVGVTLNPTSGDIFAPLAKDQRRAPPRLPCFWKVQKYSSFRTTTNLPQLLEEIEESFAEQSVDWTLENERHPHYACTSWVNCNRIDFFIRIFSESKSQLLVDIQLSKGCRCAFSELLRRLEPSLRCCPSGTLAPPQTAPLTSIPLDMHETFPELTGAEPLLDMLKSDKTSGDEAEEVCCAVASLSAQPHASTLFSDGRLVSAMQDRAGMDGDDSSSNVFAMSTIANLARASSDSAWFMGLMDSGAFSSALAGDCPHARREALRALVAISEKCDSQLRSKIVRNSIWSHVKLEAEDGLEEGMCRDYVRLDHARRIVSACS